MALWCISAEARAEVLEEVRHVLRVWDAKGGGEELGWSESIQAHEVNIGK